MKKQIKTESHIESGTKVDDGIHILKTATCPNLANKAKLTYQVGRSPEGRVHVRVVKNSSSGCFSDDWFGLDALWREMEKNSPDGGPVTSADGMRLFVGRSENTRGFVFAALKAEGFVVTSRQKRRCYDRVDAATYEAKCRALIEGKSARAEKAEKAKGAGPKPADGEPPKRAAKAPRRQRPS